MLTAWTCQLMREMTKGMSRAFGAYLRGVNSYQENPLNIWPLKIRTLL
jgi:hypothetical protein